MPEFTGGLNAFNNPRRTEEQKKNWDNFWDNLKKNKEEAESDIDLANVK